jgi:hypothetical protein
MKSAKDTMVAVSVIGLVMMGLLVGCTNFGAKADRFDKLANLPFAENVTSCSSNERCSHISGRCRP